MFSEKIILLIAYYFIGYYVKHKIKIYNLISDFKTTITLLEK